MKLEIEINETVDVTKLIDFIKTNELRAYFIDDGQDLVFNQGTSPDVYGRYLWNMKKIKEESESKEFNRIPTIVRQGVQFDVAGFKNAIRSYVPYEQQSLHGLIEWSGFRR